VRALVVDDSRATRMILRKILESIGFEVEQAENGRVALELLQSWVPYDVPDLALVDWNMPEMNGLELIEVVRDLQDFDAMKIIMCTTETEVSQMTLAMLSGANEYVMKPFTADIIVDKMALVGLEVAAP
jgi:two-component system chemotaxis response regulator CheY